MEGAVHKINSLTPHVIPRIEMRATLFIVERDIKPFLAISMNFLIFLQIAVKNNHVLRDVNSVPCNHHYKRLMFVQYESREQSMHLMLDHPINLPMNHRKTLLLFPMSDFLRIIYAILTLQ